MPSTPSMSIRAGALPVANLSWVRRTPSTCRDGPAPGATTPPPPPAPSTIPAPPPPSSAPASSPCGSPPACACCKAAASASDSRPPPSSLPSKEMITSPGRILRSRAAMEPGSTCTTVLVGLSTSPNPDVASRPTRNWSTRESRTVGSFCSAGKSGARLRSVEAKPPSSGRDESSTSAIGRCRTRGSGGGALPAAAASPAAAAGLGSGGLGDRSCRQSSWRDTPYISWPDESVRQNESSDGSCSFSTGQKQKWASESGGDASGGYLCDGADGGKWPRGDGRGICARVHRGQQVDK
eukprot:scaffold9994_cov100-Isochrysis_galbana.AAC.3